MIEPENIPNYDNNHYAVVDLGSNSFHLLITRLTPGKHGNQVSIVDKVKSKVRLASGLDDNNVLSNEAIKRGLDCLQLFSQHLQSIPVQNIKIVATAALRIASNNDQFIKQANKILPTPIELFSGEQEAQTIYAGVAYTSAHAALQNKLTSTADIMKRLVIDIGGASTEIIVGSGVTAKALVSLNIGCVSFRAKYFSDEQLSEANFSQAITAASAQISSVKTQFTNLGWHTTVGSSGTMQALAEILRYRQQPAVITLAFLQEIQKDLMTCQCIDNIAIAGLRDDRCPVLASGLSILIALFTCLNINELQLSHGALREGLLFELLPKNSWLSHIK
ncbi:hypothetical protein GCM10009111_07040 [Colwellia asteriadis]|uniref:Ppx/GppA phosphatase N-terminal domain-containing protein n=1 Tax=Colwellia asteriadis TaxID=517723 RepID=A0ABP3WGH5_9GAMM